MLSLVHRQVCEVFVALKSTNMLANLKTLSADRVSACALEVLKRKCLCSGGMRCSRAREKQACGICLQRLVSRRFRLYRGLFARERVSASLQINGSPNAA